MSHDSWKPLSAPPLPSLIVGRGKELAQLRELLTKQLRTKETGVVCFSSHSLKGARGELGLTQQVLAKRSGYGLRAIKKAEAGEPIRPQTGLDIAQVLKKPLEELTAPSGESVAVQVLIVVRGLPGVGKTTIAAGLAHDGEMRRAFPDGLLWTSLGQSVDSLWELRNWCRPLGAECMSLWRENLVPQLDDDALDGALFGLEQERRETALKTARRRLAGLLREKRVLLIIDDVWRAEDALAMIVGGPKCSILVTTRITEVADALAPSDEDIYLLNGLSDEESLELLRKLAPKVVTQHRREALELAQELERLPLALQVAGRLLRAEARNDWGIAELLNELRDAARLLGEKAPVDMASETTPTVAALLRKSTDVLSEPARKCFAYLGHYAPKPATFDLAAMASSWKTIAADPKRMAELLTARGLLEPLGGGRFWMHAMLVAHAKSLLSGSALKTRSQGRT